VNVNVTMVLNNKPEEIEGWLDAASRMLPLEHYTEAERAALLPEVVKLLSSKTVIPMMPERVEVPGVLLNGGRGL
jgi:hypothetical protein